MIKVQLTYRVNLSSELIWSSVADFLRDNGIDTAHYIWVLDIVNLKKLGIDVKWSDGAAIDVGNLPRLGDIVELHFSSNEKELMFRLKYCDMIRVKFDFRAQAGMFNWELVTNALTELEPDYDIEGSWSDDVKLLRKHGIDVIRRGFSVELHFDSPYQEMLFIMRYS